MGPESIRRRGPRLLALSLATTMSMVMVAGCGSNERDATEPQIGPESAPSQVPTLTPVPVPPDPPPSGKLIAEIRQSSIDQSRGQMQVWIDNDTRRVNDPTSIRYLDPRFPGPVAAQDLRSNPAQSERGYPLALPREPRCADRGGTGTNVAARLEVTTTIGVERVQVSDPVGVVDRYLKARCAEIALAEVADVRWSEDVPADTEAKGAVGQLRLLVTPEALTGRRLVIVRVSGTHLFNSADRSDGWELDQPITGAGEQRIDLRARPSRCDWHAFAEGGNATAFVVTFTLDGRRREVTLRMSEQGMANAFAYGATSCGIEVG